MCRIVGFVIRDSTTTDPATRSFPSKAAGVWCPRHLGHKGYEFTFLVVGERLQRCVIPTMSVSVSVGGVAKRSMQQGLMAKELGEMIGASSPK